MQGRGIFTDQESDPPLLNPTSPPAKAAYVFRSACKLPSDARTANWGCVGQPGHRRWASRHRLAGPALRPVCMFRTNRTSWKTS